ncbi:MAG: SigF/SigG family RNA polymerase sporulation sigma factor [Clostridiales bacterium]|nr:SigF/SigG family RNA polymerase sporulation sigma factor [Clostridiales bacterium]MDY3745779.1 SigF/SigG family RNA polymerase sporulation sigma factor [Lachnospiraceae bacterium]
MDRVIELLKKAKQGDKKSRDTLIEENIGLVWSIVRRFGQRGYDYDDLFQIGVIGLIKAVDYFNTDYDVRFSTYAVPMITGEIRRFLRDDGMVKVSRSIKDHAAKVHKAREKFFGENGREATAQELAAQTGLLLEEVIMAMDAGAEVDSLQKVIYQGDNNEICLMDKIEDPVDEGEKVLNRMLVENLLDQLKPNERDIIILRYYCSQTQSQIAKRLGISQVQVSRIEKKILASMREKI